MNIYLTKKQIEILNIFSKRTGRNIEELCYNFLAGYIKGLEPEARNEMIENRINELSLEEKQVAMDLLDEQYRQIEQARLDAIKLTEVIEPPVIELTEVIKQPVVELSEDPKI